MTGARPRPGLVDRQIESIRASNATWIARLFETHATGNSGARAAMTPTLTLTTSETVITDRKTEVTCGLDMGTLSFQLRWDCVVHHVFRYVVIEKQYKG